MTDEIETKPASDDFKAGAKAMFDYFQFRIANHYHGNPKVDAICQKENQVLSEWILDALEEVNPEDAATWRSLDSMYAEGFNAGKKSVTTTETKN